MDWSNYPNFSKAEFDCKHTGKCEMEPAFMDRLQTLRIAFGKPMQISSGYRAPQHPIEAAKAKPGPHSTGRACDVVVRGSDALKLVELAIKHGFTGIGVNQKGNARFIHLDDLSSIDGRPTIWSY
ncbi:MAG: peptidase M15 [Rheinheimera sp.]|uniref:D-Ala-D-Ala carboxypeptidase family metallohydrolase n=1 Tax=Arsukibacterium sp. UBA3155 TaxID=1946058 RepID=UPI000C91784A|nr:D-Ala-D-Ala carboxypeptidase family metallohydrolase [Arsukibacterium sp. UBA3155]MAD75148.1 peptidase M15 [Rheinheimera sp.]|tara:strand:- start:41784 stop:42158 length:375 start_codon:yes stop_codon:yes gene_type:complete